MIMGESAGVAAALAVKTNRAVQKIDLFALQEKLIARKQILSLKENPYGLWNSEDEIIIDNNMKQFVSFTGDWFENETMNNGRFEMNFRYKSRTSEGSAEYNPYLFKSGTYNVYLWHPVSKEFESNIAVEINHSEGKDLIRIDQNKNGGSWHKLGSWIFEKGYQNRVTIKGESGKYVIADAVKFEFVD